MFLSPWFILIGILHIGDAIHSGHLALNGRYPYIALILAHRNCREYVKCGGAILDATHIITAAQCVMGAEASTVSVFLNATTINSFKTMNKWCVKSIVRGDLVRDRVASRTEMVIEDMCGGWSYPTALVPGGNDIAILKLGESLPLGKGISKLNLPEQDPSTYAADKKFQIAGWGETVFGNRELPMNLYWTEHVILKPDQCQKLDVTHSEKAFCAMDPNKRTVLYKGDAGSPLVSGNTLVGIASQSPCTPKKPSIFTKVFDHLEFIRDAMKN